MKRTVVCPLSVLTAILLAGAIQLPAQDPATAPADPYAAETKEQRDARMKWWREARFGMFIHWGVYAVPAGTYHGQRIGGIGEWIMNQARIPCAEYQSFAKDFNPVKYDADRWVQLAKRAGMKYIVITSKHHDGFALFDSAVTGWDIAGATPYKKDLLKPLADACRRHGIRLGFYYSQAQDWNHKGGAGNNWDPAQAGSMDEYIATIAAPQVREILTKYGDDIPAVLWWDTPHSMTPDRAKPLIELLKLKPGIIHNNRLGGGFKGDTETPEQHIPATGFKDRDWETCMTMNDTWGFKSYDDNWKPVGTLIRNLVDIASKGGNYLLNVGPTAEGEIPAPSIERLEKVGDWMKVNGEAIYATSASPFRKLPWGRCTKKEWDGGTTLYLHVFDWPTDGRLVVPGLKNKVKSARLLARGIGVTAARTGSGVELSLPGQAPDPIASVVVLDIEGTPDIDPAVLANPPVEQAGDGSFRLGPDAAALCAPESGEAPQVEEKGGIPNIGFWTDQNAWVEWNLNVNKPGDFIVSADVAGQGRSRFLWGIGEAKREGSAESTGAYENFKALELGRVTLEKEGAAKLVIRPAADGWNPINVRSVTLKPAK